MHKSFLQYSKPLIICNTVGLILFIFFNLSCNAPRVNPFDPLNPEYDYGIIEGTVQTSNFPRAGVENVNILWQPENIITKTDANGRYRFNNIPLEDGTLIFYKNGYKSDTLEISWGTSKRQFTQLYLNRVPVLDSVLIYTNVINQSVRYELFVKAWITDLDEYVDTVFVYNSVHNLKKPLDNDYQATITPGELNLTDIEQTVGLDLFIITKDSEGNEFTIGSDRVTRVIKEEVTGQLPSNDDTIALQPINFQWDKYSANYYFTYTLEVFTQSTLVHKKDNIPSDSTSYSMTETLSAGSYYWVIWIIDQYQNRSRSKAATFRIQ